MLIGGHISVTLLHHKPLVQIQFQHIKSQWFGVLWHQFKYVIYAYIISDIHLPLALHAIRIFHTCINLCLLTYYTLDGTQTKLIHCPYCFLYIILDQCPSDKGVRQQFGDDNRSLPLAFLSVMISWPYISVPSSPLSIQSTPKQSSGIFDIRYLDLYRLKHHQIFLAH